MRRFDVVIRRIDALVERAQASLPGMTRLPFLVKQVAWSSGPDKTPSYEEWRAAERGEIEMSDWPGYEQHNHPAQDEQQRPRGRVIVPKLYLFDPECEGVDP